MAEITKTDVLQLAKLAMLDLTAEEVSKMVTELKSIFAMIEQIQAVNTDAVKPTAQVTGLKHVVRSDEVQDYGVLPATLLQGAQNRLGVEIKVPRVK